MPPPHGFPDIIRRPGTAPATDTVPYKPPLPTLPTSFSQHVKDTEVQVPPLIAGALVGAFANTLAEGLDNALLTHYYLSEQKVKINLDRVIDRLLSDFVRQIWDELYHFYHDTSSEPSSQVILLFEGPIRQIILILNGPETSRCVLDKIGPGLSQRPVSWSVNGGGIDLTLALQLICGFWHREFPTVSPGGCPEQIARTLHTLILNGQASKNLISEINRVLLSPNYVQVHMSESAIWDIIRKRPFPPPGDGYQLVQFKFDCQLFGPLDGIGDPQLVNIGSLPAITGTAGSCVYTTVAEYIDKQWPKCGRLLLKCLEEAVTNASVSHQQGEQCPGMSVWDSSDEDAVFCPGLRMIHLEVEDNSIRVSVSAWTHTLIEVFQQMCWTCATLSASPFPGALSECAIEVTDFVYMNNSAYVDCSISHNQVAEGDSMAWLEPFHGAAIASGFPLAGFTSPSTA
ncbi:hypothetical protein K4F52_006689 [Lecanicillium sp. MT-2017a]|nr:hypothetical protein K4F52_006689 [Lecanicillium sp. MT-2017a]